VEALAVPPAAVVEAVVAFAFAVVVVVTDASVVTVWAAVVVITVGQVVVFAAADAFEGAAVDFVDSYQYREAFAGDWVLVNVVGLVASDQAFALTLVGHPMISSCRPFVLAILRQAVLLQQNLEKKYNNIFEEGLFQQDEEKGHKQK
jgi:hypothetical protein